MTKMTFFRIFIVAVTQDIPESLPISSPGQRNFLPQRTAMSVTPPAIHTRACRERDHCPSTTDRHHGQDPGKRVRIYTGGHDKPTAIGQGNLHLSGPRGIRGINRPGPRGWVKGDRAGRLKLTGAILLTPDRQQRAANAMLPRRGCHLPVWGNRLAIS